MLLNVLERRFVLLGVRLPAAGLLPRRAASRSRCWSRSCCRRSSSDAIWCGWLCPQTIFMEMLFRKLEYLIEGSAEQQLRRDRGPWTRDRALRRGAKHVIFFGAVVRHRERLSGLDHRRAGLDRDRHRSAGRHIVGLLAILIFSFVFYMVFARFREQACVLACPYGRMLSALTDARTITITYDWRRGEPRQPSSSAERHEPARRLHRLPPVRHRLPDRDRHPGRHPAGVRQLHGVHRCVQRRHGACRPS